MVLIHGGGGTAFPDWVRRWTARGYAAIAMDTCGCVTGGEPGSRPRHDDGGPPGWGAFATADELPQDQWAYHAVAAIVRGHSLLRSLPGVDADHIGVTGVSWGGFLTCLAAGVDDRLSFAIPVYGCGHITEESTWVEELSKLPRAQVERWRELWDPSNYLPRATCPMLWVNGTNDFAYFPSSWRKSHRLPRGPRTLSLQPELGHNHQWGSAPVEIGTFADTHAQDGAPLVEVGPATLDDRRARATFRPTREVVAAALVYTTSSAPWPQRPWTVRAVDELDVNRGAVAATVPPDATAWFINLRDDRGCTVSTEHWQAEDPA
jgi:dienelactone hydrolase